MRGMTNGERILRADDPSADALLAAGWAVAARSWAAQLTAASCERARLLELRSRAGGVGHLRPLTTDDLAAILELDAATLADYPGGAATSHAPLTLERARASAGRRAHGVVLEGGPLAAMTFVDVDPDGRTAEVDFTVVAPPHRRRGLATAVKAASVLDLLHDGVTVVRTGGSADNAAILAANTTLGFVVDEEWLTLVAPWSHTAGSAT